LSELDKEAHYGRYQRGEDDARARRKAEDDFCLKMAHKGADIPLGEDSETRVSNSHSQSGLTWKEILAAGSLAGVVLLWCTRAPSPPPAVPAVPAPTIPTAPPAAPKPSEKTPHDDPESANSVLRGRIRFWLDEDSLELNHRADPDPS